MNFGQRVAGYGLAQNVHEGREAPLHGAVIDLLERGVGVDALAQMGRCGPGVGGGGGGLGRLVVDQVALPVPPPAEEAGAEDHGDDPPEGRHDLPGDFLAGVGVIHHHGPHRGTGSCIQGGRHHGTPPLLRVVWIN